MPHPIPGPIREELDEYLRREGSKEPPEAAALAAYLHDCAQRSFRDRIFGAMVRGDIDGWGIKKGSP